MSEPSKLRELINRVEPNEPEKKVIKEHAVNVAKVVIDMEIESLESKLKKCGLDRVRETIGYTNDNVVACFEKEYTTERERILAEQKSSTLDLAARLVSTFK